MTPHVPDWLLPLLRRPVAILGAGVSGRAVAGLVTQLGGSSVTYDRAAPNAAADFAPDVAVQHDLVVLSPGFAPTHPWVQTAHSAGCEVLGELDLGALAWPGEIIAITGTNGKTTLTEFLTHALRRTGRDARAVGNIGQAFCDAWRTPAAVDAIAVCEVSSFQAETLRYFTPVATLWTNFAEDHLERHGTLEAYFRAKYNLVRRTRSGSVFFGPEVRDAARGMDLDLPAAGHVAFAAQPLDARLAATVFGRPPQSENFQLVRAFWRQRGWSGEDLIAAALDFRLGAHRLSRVAAVRGVAFWNDSKATNFHAVEAALAGFDRPVLWIGGGRSKGGDVAAFIARIAPRLRHAFLIGETRDVLARHCTTQGVALTRCDSLRDAVERAFAAAASGDVVLLSPAFASFDMFTGYGDRGRQFEAIVADLLAAHGGSISSLPSTPSPNRSAPAGLCLL